MAKGGGTAPWKGVLRGAGVSLGIYLIGTALLAALIVKRVIPEQSGFPVIALLCLLAALCGGLVTTPLLPPIPGAMAAAACFCIVLAVFGGVCWQGISWMGHGGILVLCAAAGGMLAGMVSARRRKRHRKGRRK